MIRISTSESGPASPRALEPNSRTSVTSRLNSLSKRCRNRSTASTSLAVRRSLRGFMPEALLDKKLAHAPNEAAGLIQRHLSHVGVNQYHPLSDLRGLLAQSAAPSTNDTLSTRECQRS